MAVRKEKPLFSAEFADFCEQVCPMEVAVNLQSCEVGWLVEISIHF